jgi:phage anti-repressor protein
MTMPNVNHELIPITKKGEQEQWVDARTLHQFLEVGRDFSNWIKDYITDFGFVEGRDFTPILAKSTGGRQAIEYSITLDMAKHLAMLQRNEKGMQARQYFIQAEKELQRVRLALLQGYDEAETLLQSCDVIEQQGCQWYIATQIRRLSGKTNVKTELMRKKSTQYPELFMRHLHKGTLVWLVRKDAVHHILSVKPNQLLATAMVKLLNTGGVQ